MRGAVRAVRALWLGFPPGAPGFPGHNRIGSGSRFGIGRCCLRPARLALWRFGDGRGSSFGVATGVDGGLSLDRRGCSGLATAPAATARPCRRSGRIGRIVSAGSCVGSRVGLNRLSGRIGAVPGRVIAYIRHGRVSGTRLRHIVATAAATATTAAAAASTLLTLAIG